MDIWLLISFKIGALVFMYKLSPRIGAEGRSKSPSSLDTSRDHSLRRYCARCTRNWCFNPVCRRSRRSDRGTLDCRASSVGVSPRNGSAYRAGNHLVFAHCLFRPVLPAIPRCVVPIALEHAFSAREAHPAVATLQIG